MPHENLPLPEEPEYPEKSIWDINPNVEHDPDISTLDNVYRAYDTEPPRVAVDFAIYLDTIDGLLKRLHDGEISADEFMQLQQNAYETMLPPEDKE